MDEFVEEFVSHVSAAALWKIPHLRAVLEAGSTGLGERPEDGSISDANEHVKWARAEESQPEVRMIDLKSLSMIEERGARSAYEKRLAGLMATAGVVQDDAATDSETGPTGTSAGLGGNAVGLGSSDMSRTEAGQGSVGMTPVEVTMRKVENYGRAAKLAHSCRLELPKGAVVERDGIRVASPELTFLQLAGRLDIQRLIFLGLQMCSHPAGKPSEAVTTKQMLNAFLEKTSGHRGWRKAKRAVKYIENGSNSIMESLAYMMLTLPHALGGYGLGGAVFNQEIKLESEARKRLEQNRCFLDLYYKQFKLAVEYDSFSFHSNPTEQGKDALRSAALERQGIEITKLTTIQAFNSAAFEDFALNLASKLGKRISIRAKNFKEMRNSLRALLPTR